MTNQANELKPNRSPLKWGLLVLWWAVNIPLLGIPAILVAGPRRMWDEFFSYALGTYKRDRETKHLLWIRWVNYPDCVHFHYLVWGCFLLGFLQWVAPQVGLQNVFTPFGVATTVLSLVLMCLLIYFKDTPIWSLVRLCIIVALIFIADVGVRLGMGRLDNFFDGLGANGGWGRMLDYTVGLIPEALKGGVISPIWDFYVWLRPEGSPGLWVLIGLIVAVILAKPIFLAVMRNRKEMDSANLKEVSFGESVADEPISMRRSAIVIPDIFEAIFGFCDFSLKVQGGTKIFRNIFGGAFWLRKPFAELREFSTPEERRDEAAGRRDGEDAAELVPGAVHDHGDGHGEHDFVADSADGDPNAAHH